MLERFTDRARRAVILANEEARGVGQDHINTSHLLLGIGAVLMPNDDLSPQRDRLKKGPGTPDGHIPFDVGTKKIIAESWNVAQQRESTYIDIGDLFIAAVLTVMTLDQIDAVIRPEKDYR
jgi:hypothetical protein